MAKPRKALYRRRQTITLLLVALFFCLFAFYLQYFGGATDTTASLSEELRKFVSIIALILGALLGLYLCYVVVSIRRTREELKQPGFRTQPWRHDRDNITLVGRVEKVMAQRFADTIKRKLVHFTRTITGDTDPSNRFVHQRFLITSPLLRKGHRLLVLHNTDFGKVAVKAGKWVKVRGQYLHQRGREWGFFGSKLSFYGRIHRTHPPEGFIELLDGMPLLEPGDEVQVTRRPRQHDSPD